MADTIARIKNGSFDAEILLDELPRLPLANIKKLFQLMFEDSWENGEAIDALRDLLPVEVEEAKNEWATASQYYMDEFKSVRNKRMRDKKTVEQLKKNRFLTHAVKSAKAQYDRWVKIKSIFEGEKNL